MLRVTYTVGSIVDYPEATKHATNEKGEIELMNAEGNVIASIPAEDVKEITSEQSEPAPEAEAPSESQSETA